jgi:hypothetical protein
MQPTTDQQNKRKKTFYSTIQEHSYQVWFQLVQWFQRKRLQRQPDVTVV